MTITNLSMRIKCKGHYGPKSDLGDAKFCDPEMNSGYICGDCFAICEKHLDAIGMTYEEINFWLFLIIGPILFIIVLGWAIKAQYQLSLFRSLMYYPNTKK